VSHRKKEIVMNSDKDDFSSYTPDELRKLYEEDPAHFNELADKAKRKACMARTPEKSLKLQQMQWTIDMQLRKAKTPLGRMNIMEEIFYSKVYGAKGELEQLISSCNSLVRAITGADRQVDRKAETGRLRRV